MATSVQKIVRVQASRKRKMTAPTYYPPQENVDKSRPSTNSSWENYYAISAKLEPSEVRQSSNPPSQPIIVNSPLAGENPAEAVTVAPTSEESLPLHESAKQRYPLTLNDASDVNERDLRQRTALHWLLVTHHKTAEQKTRDMMTLLEAGAQLNAQDDQGKTPLILAIESGLEDIACLLLDRGADPNTPDCRYWTPLHHAVKMLSKRLVETLLGNESVDIEATTDEGETPLLICSREGKPAALHIAPILLKRKANPHSVGDVWLQSNTKRTPLHWAAELNNDLLVKFLVESGANKNAQDADGRTPLFLAASNGSDAAVRMLLHLNADSTLADVDDKTPLRAAHEQCFDCVVRDFEENKATKIKAISGLTAPPEKRRRLKQSPPLDAKRVVASQRSSGSGSLAKPVAYQPAYATQPYMSPEAAHGIAPYGVTGHQQWHMRQQGPAENMSSAHNINWAMPSPHQQHTGLSPMFSRWLPMRDERAPAFFMQVPNAMPAARPTPSAASRASLQDARGVPVGSAPQGAPQRRTSCSDMLVPSAPQQTPPTAVEKDGSATPAAPQSSVMMTPPSENKRRSSSTVKPEPDQDGEYEMLGEFFVEHPYNVTQLLSL